MSGESSQESVNLSKVPGTLANLSVFSVSVNVVSLYLCHLCYMVNQCAPSNKATKITYRFGETSPLYLLNKSCCYCIYTVLKHLLETEFCIGNLHACGCLCLCTKT